MCILYKRNFLRLLDFKPIEINYLISLSTKLKNAKKNNNEVQYLKGKNIVLLFEKDSTRTRCSFEVAAYDQGANITHLSSQGSQLNYKESMKDTARVLGRIYNGIQFRGYTQKTLKILAKYSDIPVWNGLTNEFHPTQLLADLLTIQEHLPNKNFNEIKLIYIGDGRNNISNSILEATALFGFDLYIISPKIFWPNIKLVNHCLKLAKSNGGNIIITDKIDKDIKGADFIYTDVWVSMGEPQHIWKKRIPYLKKYQVNNNLLEFIENSQIKFLHCLPSFHDNQSVLGKKISKEYKFKNGIEVSNDIFESKHSVVFDQSENRMHTIKAIIVSSLYQNIESLL